MAITRAGETFSGYNKPKRSRKGGKKFAVLAKQGDTVKLIRFGDANMTIKGYSNESHDNRDKVVQSVTD